MIVPFLVTAPFRKQNYFRQDIWFNIDRLQSTKLVKDMSRGALFSQQTLSKGDSSLVTSLLAAPKLVVLFPNSHHGLLFQMLV